MKLKKLNSTEFRKWANAHPQITFHQTKEWANLKEKNGWYAYFVGLEDNNKILAAAMILAKTIPVCKKRIFYSPRGFLLDYKDKELLTIFTKEITEFAKKRKGIFIKIDPYVMYKQRDINGDLVPGGLDNSIVVDNLKQCGYQHKGFHLMQEDLQPRWMHTITVYQKSKENLMKDMDPKTRQILRKNERLGVKVREITREELPVFKDIMQHTSDRRDFVDRPLSYYEHMWDSLHDSGILKILIAEIDFDEETKNTQQEIEKLEQSIKERAKKFADKSKPMNEKKFLQKQEFEQQEINRLTNNLVDIEQKKEKYGQKPILGGILFLCYGNEVVSLYGGSKAELMSFQSAYTLHWAGIKYALENGYHTYNFYGITGDFSESNPLLGLYLFKKSFGGQVVELVGEFDLIISKPWYFLYNSSFKCYHALKKIKNKLHH